MTRSKRPIPGYTHLFEYRFPRLYDLEAIYIDGFRGLWRDSVKAARLRPGEAALDVCCGTGGLTLALLSVVGQEGEVVGIDLSQKMLTRARKKNLYPRDRFIWADAREMPLIPDRFDVVTVCMALHQMPATARGKVLREMKRVAKPGGRIVIAEPKAPRNRVLRLYWRLLVSRHVYEMDALIDEVQGSGLEVADHTYHGRFWRYQVITAIKEGQAD